MEDSNTHLPAGSNQVRRYIVRLPSNVGTVSAPLTCRITTLIIQFAEDRPGTKGAVSWTLILTAVRHPAIVATGAGGPVDLRHES